MSSDAERPPRRLVAAAATLALVGIAFSVSGSEALGAWITVGALLGLIAGLHRFGRTGPE